MYIFAVVMVEHSCIVLLVEVLAALLCYTFVFYPQLG